MSLYRNLINESLEDDRRAQNEVIARLRKNNIDTTRALKADIADNEDNFNQFRQMTINLLNFIDTVLLEMEEDINIQPGEEEEEEEENVRFLDLKDYIPKIIEIVTKYNNITFTLLKNKFSSIPQQNKNKYFDFILKIKPSLEYIIDMIQNWAQESRQNTDIQETLKRMEYNIANRTLLPIGVEDSQPLEIVSPEVLQRKAQKNIDKLMGIHTTQAEERAIRREERARRRGEVEEGPEEGVEEVDEAEGIREARIRRAADADRMFAEHRPGYEEGDEEEEERRRGYDPRFGYEEIAPGDEYYDVDELPDIGDMF